MNSVFVFFGGGGRSRLPRDAWNGRPVEQTATGPERRESADGRHARLRHAHRTETVRRFLRSTGKKNAIDENESKEKKMKFRASIQTISVAPDIALPATVVYLKRC